MSTAWTFGLLLLWIGVGRALCASRLLPAGTPDILNRAVLYFCLPASILLHAPQLHLRAGLLALVAVPWLLLLVSAVAVYFISRRCGFPRDQMALLLLLVPMGNTAFLGYALVPALAGAPALPYAVIYDQFGSFLILASYGLAIVAWFGGGERPRLRSVLRRMLGFPPFLALLFALSLMPASAPAWVTMPLQLLNQALLPMVALAIGMRLVLRLPRGQGRVLLLGLAGKLLLLPALALLLALCFGMNAPMRSAVLFESAMPPMITAAALASLAGLAPQLAAAMVGYGTLLAALSLPAWRWLLQALGLL